jgi:hypothetical protein
MYTSTTTTSPSLFSVPAVRQGWQCPLCLLVYSPDVQSCSCDQESFIQGEIISVDWTPGVPTELPHIPEFHYYPGDHRDGFSQSCTVAGCTLCK